MNLKHWSFPIIFFLSVFLSFWCFSAHVFALGGGGGLVGGGGDGGGRLESICCGRMLPFRPMKVINELGKKKINQSANWVAQTPPPLLPVFSPLPYLKRGSPSSILDDFSWPKCVWGGGSSAGVCVKLRADETPASADNQKRAAQRLLRSYLRTTLTFELAWILMQDQTVNIINGSLQIYWSGEKFWIIYSGFTPAPILMPFPHICYFQPPLRALLNSTCDCWELPWNIFLIISHVIITETLVVRSNARYLRASWRTDLDRHQLLLK